MMSWNQWHSDQLAQLGSRLVRPRPRWLASSQHPKDIPRKIQASACATKHGLAGRNLEEIRLHELTWQDWSNRNLRAFPQGRYVSVNFSRSIKEATFTSYLLQHLREHKLDLEQITECFCADSGIQVSSATPENSKKTARKVGRQTAPALSNR